jgi:hypothetical protein
MLPAEMDRLEADVRTRLRGQVAELYVLVEEKGIRLRGRARTWYVKQLAQHAVMQASKLPLVANEIEVP